MEEGDVTRGSGSTESQRHPVDVVTVVHQGPSERTDGARYDEKLLDVFIGDAGRDPNGSLQVLLLSGVLSERV